MSKWSTPSEDLETRIWRALIVGRYTETAPVEYLRQTSGGGIDG